MTESWFDSQDKIVALQNEACSWQGTPFFANSAVKGRGVCCHKLAGEIYAAVGWHRFEIPAAPMAHARFARVSLVEPWLDARPEFARLPADEAGLSIGDLLGFRLGKVVHHLGIYIGGWQFVHAMDHIGVNIHEIDSAPWCERLAAVWRPRKGVEA